MFVSMHRSVVHYPRAVVMPYLLTMLNFSDMPGAYGIIADPMGFSYAV